MTIASSASHTMPRFGWRVSAVILMCGRLISLLSFGPRATLGFFLAPQSQAAVINLPIVEKPVRRLSPAEA
jgi:hypothetical protein